MNVRTDKPVCHSLLFSDAAERTGKKEAVLRNKKLI